MEMAGQWLEKALLDLCKKTENGLDLDGDLISGLVSYCELASPVDAKEYLDNIVGQQAGKSVIGEYLKRRGYSDVSDSSQDAPPALLRGYVKPPSDEGTSGSKKMSKAPKDAVVPPTRENRVPPQTTAPQNQQKGNQASSKKKKTGKVISLAEASKGSIVFQQGKPCSCQARRHRLISNCLSCGKIICEQEGEGPCSFCGALVLREGSTYAGLEEGVVPLSDAEAAAEAYAKRLVDYDRNSAARTNVIDDQSDYYEIEGNSWLSMEEKELLSKKKEEIEEAERANKSKVIMTIDLLGRKVLLNEEDEASDEIKNSILFQPTSEREGNRIKPNPTVQVQPVFLDPGPTKKNTKNQGKHLKKNLPTGMCLEISGRVQHDDTSALKVL